MTYFEREGLSQSAMMRILESWRSYLNPPPKTEQMEQGTAFHYAVLEPDKFEKLYKINYLNRTTKEAKDLKEGGFTVLSAKQSEFIEKGLENLQKHPLYWMFEGKKEVEMFWHEEVLMKGKTDVINDDFEIILDLKTCQDVTKAHNLVKFDYSLQARHYLDGYKSIYGKEYDFVFCFVDKTDVRFIQVTPDTLNYGAELKKQAIEKYLFYSNNPLEYDGKYKELDYV